MILSIEKQFAMVVIATLVLTSGCRYIQPARGTPINKDAGLGSVVDQVNQQQEENAEASKFVLYEHEFEVNVPLAHPEDGEVEEKFQYQPEERLRGFRMTPLGEMHLMQIAEYIVARQMHQYDYRPRWGVVVERSTSSKRWETKHRYPVHFNPELDEARRQTVVMALTGLGVQNADQMVVVAPAFAEGLEAPVAAGTYIRSR